jgi:hypothetical protein
MTSYMHDWSVFIFNYFSLECDSICRATRHACSPESHPVAYGRHVDAQLSTFHASPETRRRAHAFATMFD